MCRWQQIKGRDWRKIREIWINHVPPIPSRAASPSLLVESIVGAGVADKSLSVDDLNVCPDKLREAVLWEAIFLLHKGGHAIGAAQATLAAGRISWSQFNAYHGAFLVGRSILAFLGVTVPRPGGQSLLVDMFPTVPDRKKQKPRGPILSSQFQLWRTKGQVEQGQFWELLARTIRMTKGAAWDQEIAESILAVKPGHFSRRRNPFIYSAPFWPFNDLIAPSTQLQILSRPANFPADFLLDDAPQFLWIAALFTFHLAIKLLKDLAGEIPLIEQELLAFQHGYWPVAGASYQILFGQL